MSPKELLESRLTEFEELANQHAEDPVAISILNDVQAIRSSLRFRLSSDFDFVACLCLDLVFKGALLAGQISKHDFDRYLDMVAKPSDGDLS